ncbi:cupin-like domain-containing protein [archaeon]|nr:MAG: cupin-like domain-containing protein [archaeon]
MKCSNVLSELCTETQDFWTSVEVPVIDTSFENVQEKFVTEALTRYHPVIIKGLIDNWPALRLWDRDYLINKVGDAPVSINLTPDGRADSVQSIVGEGGKSVEHFVFPAETKMSMANFFSLLDDNQSSVVAYLSQQNDNLRAETSCLLSDIAESIPLADKNFGKDKLEAVNLWIGDEKSVSSMHKDHFENMYAVVSGAKTFVLLPPTDVAFLPSHSYPTCKYIAECDSTTNKYDLSISFQDCPSETLEWVDLDPDDMELAVQKWPKAHHLRPLHIEVHAGDVLYIPAMWYHRVSQKERTVAVNYWYDMRFDFRYVSPTTPLHLLNTLK